MTYCLRLVFEQIHARLTTKPNTPLKDLATILGVERHTLEKAIRTETGKSFREFRRHVMFNTVCSLLGSKPGSAIKEVSAHLGYNSPRAFARFVSAVSGSTPTELRKKLISSKHGM